jgi:hypothetical protein
MIYYIGIHGPKRVGKDSFGFALQCAIDLWGHADACACCDRMAAPLYEWAASITGMTIERLMGKDKDLPLDASMTRNRSLWGISSRQVLLDIGIFVRRTYGMDFLNNCLEMRSRVVNEHRPVDYPLFVIVTDIRTEAEAAMMDLTFDLTRDGCVYENTITEHAFDPAIVKNLIPIHIKTIADDKERSRMADFSAIVTDHIKPLLPETV